MPSLKPSIIVSSGSFDWAAMATEIIERAISATISKRGICHLMLTGGNAAKDLYLHWAQTFSLPLERIRFLFGDERCVPPDHAESNYALVMKTLFSRGIPKGC